MRQADRVPIRWNNDAYSTPTALVQHHSSPAHACTYSTRMPACMRTCMHCMHEVDSETTVSQPCVQPLRDGVRSYSVLECLAVGHVSWTHREVVSKETATTADTSMHAMSDVNSNCCLTFLESLRPATPLDSRVRGKSDTMQQLSRCLITSGRAEAIVASLFLHTLSNPH